MIPRAQQRVETAVATGRAVVGTAQADLLGGKETTPTPARGASFRSGGLGLSRVAWERAHGRPTGKQAGAVRYEDGLYTVTFQSGKVARISWTPRRPVALKVARATAAKLLPEDAKRTGSDTGNPGEVTDRYRSPGLARQLQPGGDFTVVYELQDSKVRRAVIGR